MMTCILNNIKYIIALRDYKTTYANKRNNTAPIALSKSWAMCCDIGYAMQQRLTHHFVLSNQFGGTITFQLRARPSSANTEYRSQWSRFTRISH